MATRIKDIPKNISVRDVFHTAPRASAVGVAGMRQLETVAEIKAEALALYYDITGTVSRDVPEELRSNAYEIQKGRISPLGAVDNFCSILMRRVYVRRNLSLPEARFKAARMMELARQLIDLKLPVDPNDPTQGHTLRSLSEGETERGVGRLVGSDDLHHEPQHEPQHESQQERQSAA